MKQYFMYIDKKYEKNGIYQFIKFNLSSFSITLIQLLLANIFPLLFDSYRKVVPDSINKIFIDGLIDSIDSKYIINGVITWGYLLPFFLSNFIANIYGYFINMHFTFKSKGNHYSIIIYCIVLFILIIISTWLQSLISSIISKTQFAYMSRSIAALLAGLFQVVIIFPLEKYILFKEG